MSHEAIQELLHRRPFVRFRVHLSSGEAHEVRHPELAILLKSRIIIADPATDRSVTCALLHIVSAEEVQAV